LAVMRRLWKGEQVGAANIKPWPGTEGGPRVLLGSWASEQWVRRAAEDFDGWMTPGANTGFNNLRDAIKRYRHAGGQRAEVTSVRVDLTGAHEPLDPDGPFRLVCSAQEASDRLQRVAGLGYDDVIVFNFDVNKLDWTRSARWFRPRSSPTPWPRRQPVRAPFPPRVHAPLAHPGPGRRLGEHFLGSVRKA
jgi:alkanesulfonate monooxygenase SsuD/methylene tetrahydromethanopterin reductase-like flavin-dependent oxidoreductase (luciferase family)